MHQSSLENMQKCFDRYVWDSELLQQKEVQVLDVGGADVNGSYSDVFQGPPFTYLGADLQSGPGVSVVLKDPNRIPLPDKSINIVISGQMLEHCENFWLVFTEMVRVLKEDGFLFLIAPSGGPIHRYPVDCYRFYPDAYKALADYGGCYLVDCWMDQRGPWNDLVGVFSRKWREKITQTNQPFIPARTANAVQSAGSAEDNRTSGKRSYIEVLSDLHSAIQPERYLEIGVREGRSLQLAGASAVGVDPDPDINVQLDERVRLVRQTSDDFFDANTDIILKQKPDLVFIDGMHLFEYALRDFMNAERHCHSNSVIVIDDILPNTPIQAARERQTRVWTGDVWKLLVTLREHRPDLKLTLLDTSPTGLLVISNLDPANRVLWNKYNPIARRFNKDGDALPPADILQRRGAIDPASDFWRSVCDQLATPSTSPTVSGQGPAVAPKPTRPKASIIVISYNMSRELPRTLKTLVPPIQQDVSVDEVEILAIDNGSTEPFDKAALEAISPNIRVIQADTGSPSPVQAINLGLAEARSDFVGVMIDGARMASPGLISRALEARTMHPRAVVGTVAFHLGSKVQMEAIKEGYNQAVEDDLLASVPWEEDGYALFDISVFAGSSAGGWLRVPAETNALFMDKALWTELGGYDERFQAAGGGYANLDTWKRACNLPNAQVIMLLGETTFHQVHGGVATNAVDPPNEAFKAEYKSIHGEAYTRPAVSPLFHGTFHRVSAVR